MTPGAIIALVKDALIIMAIGVAIWMLVTYGKDIVKVADMKALQKQLTSNTVIEANWRKEQTDANTQRDATLAQVAAGIAEQRTPVIVRNGAARACPVSVVAAQAGRSPAAAGGTDAGPRGDPQPVDQRPAVNAYELKIETAIADCRAALDGWPK